MRTMRFGRSRWQRRAGAVAFVAAGALVLASCSSGPKGVNVLGPPAKPPTRATAVKTVQFPSGPVAEHIYGPSWARFVAAFPGKVAVGTGPVRPCVPGTVEAYDATAGTPLTGGAPVPPSYDVLIWRCGTAAAAAARARGIGPVEVVIDGHRGFESTIARVSYSAHGSELTGSLAVQSGAVLYGLEGWAKTPADIRSFFHSFHLDLTGFTSVK
ncbi:MAG: hypothetical protein ACYCTE_10550 [Acidimicrobiales bacterium]